MVSRKVIEHRLANPSDYECIEFQGRTYVQVDVAKTQPSANQSVAGLHAKGYLARAVPIKGWKQKAWMIFAHHAPKKEVHHFISPMDWHSGAMNPRSIRRVRVVKGS